MIRTSTFLVAFAASLLTVAQTPHTRDCATHSITQRYLAEQGMSTDIAAALPHVDLAQRGGGTYTIPVVVHVVYNTTAENVSTAAIQAIITELNQDYSQSNTNLNTVRASFTGVIGNVGFQFCLAQIDPQGNPTTGITRTQTTETWFDPDTETNLMKSAPAGISPWAPSQYLNIWVCDITSGAQGGLITVGYAYLPVGGVVGSNIDGLVIDYNYGLSVGDRTATHEIGHYFGLRHTFDDNGTCNNVDGFTDTPNSNSPTFSCSNTNLMKCSVLTQYENFMDYANCSAMFTVQQANYMAGIVTGVRAGLLNSNACGSTPVGYCTPTSTNGTADGDFINTVQLGSINNANTGGTTAPTYTNYSATIGTNLQQGTAYTLTVQGGTYQPDHYAAWIDYDQDEVFEAGEKLGEFTSNAANQTLNFPFTVPAGATLGATRLRVRGVYHNTGEPTPNTDPCFSYAFGETEDYRITITGASTAGPCIPTSTNGTAEGDFINRVQLATINNANSGGITAPTYTNFSATHSTSLGRGGNYTVTIQGGSYQPDHYAVWIDYDQDDTFETAEKLGEFTTTTLNETQAINFTVPVSATLGGTRMRVRGVFHNQGEPTPNTDPCFAYAWGETEDYGIVIATTTNVEERSVGTIQLYPNPATGSFNLSLPSNIPATVELIDLQGRTVAAHRTNSASAAITLDGIATGAYMVRVRQGDLVRVVRLEVSNDQR